MDIRIARIAMFSFWSGNRIKKNKKCRRSIPWMLYYLIKKNVNRKNDKIMS